MSLVELLVVLVIVSLAYTLILPSMRNPTRSVSLRVIAQNMSSHLAASRSRSIATNRPLGVTFDVSNHLYRLDTDGRSFVLPRELRLAVTSARSLSREEQRTARIVFYPDGSSSGGNIRLEQNGQAIDLGVEWLTGQVHVVQAP